MQGLARKNIAIYLAATGVGVLAGLVGAAFHFLIERADDGRAALRDLLQDGWLPGWLAFAAIGAVGVTVALALVRRVAPEAGGSGVPEIEHILGSEARLRWWRVLPTKLLGGLAAIGSGLVLGREGPTIHMGGSVGAMASEWLRLDRDRGKTLIAAGAAAGLAAAFNAPLAAIVFVTEEMREDFDYSFVSLQSVISASCAAVIVSDWWLGQGPAMPVADLPLPPLGEWPLFLVLGVVVGVLGVLFNGLLLGAVRAGERLRGAPAAVVGVVAGAAVGLLAWFLPDTVGGGEHLVERAVSRHWETGLLLMLLVARLVTTVASFGTGVPGGIFAPLLALGTLTGVGFGIAAQGLLGDIATPSSVFAVASMGALFAATVRAPLTGIVLIVELTGAYGIGLAIILTCLSASFTAQALGSRPVYQLLREHRLRVLGGGEEPSPEP